jgi:hypothetical protein
MTSEMIAPTINYIKLNSKQRFPTRENIETINGVTITPNGVAKNTIKFKRLEDMIVICLSTFVHDYVHDYNLGSMHSRVIKGNILRTNPEVPSLFETLGIKIGNKPFKILNYNINSGPRDVSMYDDSKFEDVPIKPGDKQNFINYLSSYEMPIETIGGLRQNKSDKPTIMITPDLDDKKKQVKELEKINEQAQKEEEKEEPVQIEKEEPVQIEKEEPVQKEEEKEELNKPEEFVKATNMEDFKDILTIPSISYLNFKIIVDKIEKNADFLAFHSSLNTYIITYLGYGYDLDIDSVDSEDKNIIMNEAIQSSFRYIINDFDNASREKTLDLYTAIFYADIFRLLLLSYISITNKTNNDYKQNVLDVLNSSVVLYQFIIFYVSYLSVEDYKEFEKINQIEQKGGEGTPDGDGDGDALLPLKQKEVTPIPEYVYITHHNLLTTIARGMFIKLGIWKKIFFPDRIPRPDEYIFGVSQMNQITYEKLVEIYPIDPEIGHRNNELLILEILILKRLLLEMSPSKTLIFGNKIDDELKNYMDTFYYDYYIKDTSLSYKPEIQIEDEVVLNPEVSADFEKEAEQMFEICEEEECDNFENNDFNGFKMENGGGKTNPTEDGIEMIEIKHKTPPVVQEPINILTADIKYTLPKMPIIFDKLKKMYQNNIYTIKQLQKSQIEPIIIEGKTINNLYELLKLNETLIHLKDTNFNISAPKYKFIINNAANIGSNINGSKMFYINKYVVSIKSVLDELEEVVKKNNLSEYTSSIEKELDEKNQELDDIIMVRIKELMAKKQANIMTIREFNELEAKILERNRIEKEMITPLDNKLYLIKLINNEPSKFEDFKNNYNKWFKDSQPFFGLYRNLQRGIFCPTSSMMDAMDNCSLKYNSTEPKEVGTTYSEILFEDNENNINISFGGVVLNYNQLVNENEELTSRLYYEFICSNESNGQTKDTMVLSTLDIKVSESNDLKARVAYKGVINKIKELYDNPIPNQTVSAKDEPYIEEETKETIEIELVKKTKKQKVFDKQMTMIKNMWINLQYQYNPNNFNSLLSSTVLKTMGDYLQECQCCFKWGGYVSSTEAFPVGLNRSFLDNIKDKIIYRSVSKGGIIVPYDENGNALRLGVQGDRPSGFRSIYMLLNGTEAVNSQAITGYMYTFASQNPSRSLLVSRNLNNINDKGLNGNVLFVTRELQTPQKEDYLKELAFLSIKEKSRKVEGEIIEPEIGYTLDNPQQTQIVELIENPNVKVQPFKNSSYAKWDDYETHFVPTQEETKLNIEETDRERELRLKREERERNKTPEAKAEKARVRAEEKAEKERIKAEELAKAKAEKERVRAEEKAEKERVKAEELAKANAEKERVRAEEKAEKERIKAEELAKANAEKERVRAEAKIEKERIKAEEKAEKERIKAEKTKTKTIKKTTGGNKKTKRRINYNNKLTKRKNKIKIHKKTRKM